MHLCIIDKYDLYACRPELPTLLSPTLEKISDFKFIPENLLKASLKCFEAIAEHYYAGQLPAEAGVFYFGWHL